MAYYWDSFTFTEVKSGGAIPPLLHTSWCDIYLNTGTALLFYVTIFQQKLLYIEKGTTKGSR
jgi:hypothetical protein